MYSNKDLEEFFSQYLPGIKDLVEYLWANERGTLQQMLSELSFIANSDWMQKYFEDFSYLAKTTSHKYTNPWKVL